MTARRRYQPMRIATLLVGFTMVAGACGSSPEQVGESVPSPVSTTTPASTATSPTTSTLPGERPAADSQSSAAPEDGFPPDEPVQRLSIEDALLPDDAFAAPWEPQWRQLDAIGYGAGPNQTDCAEYWAYEELLGGDGGHVMWWADGGNANHRVTRIADEGEVLARLVALGSLAENCPIVRWNEGGEFAIEVFTPDVEAFVMRFTDAGSGEVTWVAITLFGDLISVLQIPLWTRADGTMIDITLEQMTSWAAEMVERLRVARVEPTPLPATTDVPPPRPTVPATTDVPPPLPTVPATTDVPPPLPTVPATTVAVDDLGRLLLASDQLPAGWELVAVTDYSAGAPDDEIVAVCPAAESLNVIDAALTWEAEFEDGSRQASQLIGDLPDEVTAVAMVRQFAEVAACDLDEIIPGSVSSGGLVDIDGADAAAAWSIAVESERLLIELGAVAIGSTVVVFSIESVGGSGAGGDELSRFMSSAVAKIVAA